MKQGDLILNLKYHMKFNHEIEICISGNCMIPHYYNGDNVKIARKDKYCLGDIVLIWCNNKLLAHRIVKLNRDGSFITKGDHSYFVDPMQDTEILGCVIENITRSVKIKNSLIKKYILAKVSYLNSKIYAKYLRNKNKKNNGKIYHSVHLCLTRIFRLL